MIGNGELDTVIAGLRDASRSPQARMAPNDDSNMDVPWVEMTLGLGVNKAVLALESWLSGPLFQN